MRARAGSEFRLSTSRTETARIPLAMPVPVYLLPTPVTALLDVYTGPPVFTPANAAFPGHTVQLPFADCGLQLQVMLADPKGMVFLTVDLGSNRDLARIELYGNPLLSPVTGQEKPVHNFGVPRRIHVLTTEEEFFQADLHRQQQRGQFYSNPFVNWREVWSSQDVRALWAWTPIHLDAAFGRYLTFVFTGLPEIQQRDGTPAFGVDLHRIVVFPYLEDVDHRPQVEHSIVSARVSNFSVHSDYWTRAGQPAPAPATHQSVFFDQAHDDLPLPCALNGIPAESPAAGTASMFVSHPVPADPSADNRIYVVTQATTDHEPLLEGVRLVFRPPEGESKYQGPKLDFTPDYLIRVHVTSDREAAYSSDPAHRSWRLAAAEEAFNPDRQNEVFLFFAEPVAARWVRLTVRPSAPPPVPPGTPTVFFLHRLDLLRSQSWQLAPGPDEDIDVDTVFIRLRGPRILDDYAYIEGRAGFGITVEARGESGAYETLRSFRNLMEVIEETHHRIFSNHRRIEKPVQRYHEVTDSQSSARGWSTQRSLGSQTATVLPAYNNRQVIRSGTLTNYVRNPHNNLGDTPLAGLPDTNTTGVLTTRTYEGDLGDVPPPNVDLTTLDPAAVFNSIVDWVNALSAQGFPISLGVGGNIGFGGGPSVVVSATLSGGVSVNAGGQIGGGVTLSETRGDQGSVVRSETLTVESRQKQKIRAANFSRNRQRTRGHDDRTVLREDLSDEVREPGVEVRYGGEYEDLVLITIPVGRRFRGGFMPQSYTAPVQPAVSRESLRVRVDYLPPGVRMDVQFRGRSVPHPEVR
jgi:hypothetical protein